MKYMLLICTDHTVDDVPEVPAGDWADEMSRRGVRLDGNRLRPPSDATTVRVRGDEVLVADGPFAETKDLMAGYDIIEVADLDEAVEVAAAHPFARYGQIEIRPYWLP
ncbi:YciI family protein [Microbispora sp. ATCC PTA-5024]|uniref:YciI family protein n=1 Tax=Microbispora sp. ATCC PTA-5024 TaxID=316330 RepID=UPI0003DB7153|nr:YciI family protein [Microbispora sp. ATCC PTA-5024]ETK35085.1 transcription initiation protein [Microbispora sp. ATCC PTA-5024]